MSSAKRPNINYADKVMGDVSNPAAVAATAVIPMQTMDGDYRCDKFEIADPSAYATDAANYYDISLQTAPRAITAATTDIVTLTAHGFQTGDAVQFTTTGSLPGGISAATTYYVVVLTVDTFKLSDTFAHAVAGTNIIDITSTGATSLAAKLMAMYSLLTGQQASLVALTFASAVNFPNPVGLKGDQLNVVLTKFGTAANFPAGSQFVAHLKQLTNS